MLRRIFTTGFGLLFWWGATECEAQVWPGDVNDNGIVNNIDLLYMGEAFFTFGPPRAPGEQGPDWEEKTIDMPWPEDFPNGVNHAFADCDGDGFVVDDYVIEQNYGLTHGTVIPDDFTTGTQGNDPPLFAEAAVASMFESSLAFLRINLGTPALTVSDMQGIAFTIRFDPDIFTDISAEFFPGEWIETDASDVLVVVNEDEDEGTIDVALRRIGNDTGGLSGFGEVALFFIVIEDNVVGMSDPSIETPISIEKVRLLDEDFNETPVYADTTLITILNDDPVTSTTEAEENAISIYPHPASSFLMVESPQGNIRAIEVTSLSGKLLLTQDYGFGQRTARLDTSGLPAGLHAIKVLTDDRGWLVKKITIQP